MFLYSNLYRLTRDQIITHLTKVKYIQAACHIAGELRDDLFQHIWVKILEIEPLKIEDIYKKGYLDFYILRMIRNEATNKNNPFLRGIILQKTESNWQYKNAEYLSDGDFNVRRENEFISDLEPYDHEADNQFETTLCQVKEKLKTLYWYDRTIFELYLTHKSLRKVSAETGIKYGAIHQTITKVKKQIHESVADRN